MDIFKSKPDAGTVFGCRLRKARIDKGLTQVQVGEKIDIDCRNLYRWETGSHVPNLRTFVKLCKIYGVTPNEMLGF